ncbi:MAG: ABC transporter ATP-binding protein [Deltaproteobacteria bacterium]|nr:ABC transporter ATP-binding protein [Deltaproteobacteria bacterium]
MTDTSGSKGGIRIQGLSIDLGDFHLRDIDLEVRPGEYLVLVGPTGSGKTVLLECLVGIHRPSAGRIFLGEVEVSGLAPEARGLGYVPQDYALFPSMSVADNLAFGLRARRLPQQSVIERLDELCAALQIEALRDRRPATLSGGEQQRVALGRALAIEPDVLLLDEPLSALDEHLRWEVCAELERIHRDLGCSFVHVCHDFEEAAAVAERMAVMREGRIVQVGTLGEIRERPADVFVARFTRARNILDAEARPDDAGACRLVFAGGASLRASITARGAVQAVIRPEFIRLAGDGDEGNVLRCRLDRIRSRFAHLELVAAAEGGLQLVLHAPLPGPGEPRWTPGQSLRVHVPPECIHVIELSHDPQP